MQAIECNQSKFGPPIYFLDSNAYINFSKFYYKGKCVNPDVTEYIRKLLIHVQDSAGYFQYDFAAKETAFDYGANQLNADVFRQTVFGVDTLITQVSSKELLHYNGAVGKVLWVERSGMCSCNSVFDCNFPKVVIQDESERGIFYLSYLYRLKIQELYDNKDLAPMERLRQLFFYMSEVIGVIGDIELQLGKMLFIGDKDASTASSILKIDGKRNIQTINNSVADIVLFRIAQRTGSLSPFPVYFVSGDIGLQKLFSLNRTLIAGVGVASLSEDSSDVHENLWNEWEDFYNSYVESRKFLAFAQPYFIEQHFDDIVRKINEEIVNLENHLFK